VQVLQNVREDEAIKSFLLKIVWNFSFNVVNPTFAHPQASSLGFGLRSGDPEDVTSWIRCLKKNGIISGAAPDIQHSLAT
jgi:hypothetical protein